MTVRRAVPIAILPALGGSAAVAVVGLSQMLAIGWRRAATLADRNLRDARPGDIPFEQPTTVELVVNGRTARALGLKIAQELVWRADEVIE